MNKAFVRESDHDVRHCPFCGSLGQAVGRVTLDAGGWHALTNGKGVGNLVTDVICQFLLATLLTRHALR